MYTQVKNPRWATEDHSSIDCEVVFPAVGPEFIPFSANPNDMYEYNREIYQKCLAGEFGPIAEYEAPVYETRPEGVPAIPHPRSTVQGAQTL